MKKQNKPQKELLWSPWVGVRHQLHGGVARAITHKGKDVVPLNPKPYFGVFTFLGVWVIISSALRAAEHNV